MKEIEIYTEERIIPETVLALSAPYPVYTIAWEFNKLRNEKLSPDVGYTSPSKKHFPTFSMTSIIDNKDIILIQNHSKDGKLSARYKKIDFFLCLISDNYEEDLAEILNTIKQSSFIRAAIPVKADRSLKAMLKRI